MSDSQRPHGLKPTRLLHPWDFPGKSTGVGCHCLLYPSYIVGTNYRVLIYCTCHFQGGSLCFSFFCSLVSSVSDFRPDTRGWWWTLFQSHLFSRAVGREGHCQQITLVCAHSDSATLGLPLPLLTVCVLSLSILLQTSIPSPNLIKMSLHQVQTSDT